MPHYKDGTPAQVGDVVMGPGYSGSTLVGPVTSISPQSDSCNMSIGRPMQIFDGEGGRRVVLPNTETVTCVTCKEFVKLFAVLLAVTLFAGVASAQSGQVAPRIDAATVVVGQPPDQQALADGGHAQAACANCRQARPAAAAPLVRTVAAPIARPAKRVARFVARPVGKAIRFVGRVARFPFRAACRRR